MVIYTNKKPHCFDKEMPAPGADFKYFELFHDNEIYGFSALDFRFNPFCLLHLEIIRWNHLVYAELVDNDWPFAKKLIKSMGYNMVVLTKKGRLSSQRSYLKLIKKCGFLEPIEFTQAQQEI